MDGDGVMMQVPIDELSQYKEQHYHLHLNRYTRKAKTHKEFTLECWIF